MAEVENVTALGAPSGAAPEVEPEEGATPEEYLAAEGDLLDALTTGAEEVSEATEVIWIKREGGKDFWFRVRGIGEEEDEELMKRNTVYQRDKRFANMPVMEDRKNWRYRSEKVIKATVAFCVPVGHDDKGTPNRFKDVESHWESSELRKRLRKRDGQPLIDQVEVVDALLKPGEKDHVLEIIDKLGGVDMEETAKN